MFTADQLIAAHSKVKSGADFPAYIQEIKSLGVTHYEAYVADGHLVYHGEGDYTVTVPEKYEPVTIADRVHLDEFKEQLLAHQQGKTDYITFIKMCADTGIEKWEIRMDDMTCIYFDKKGNKLLTEQIPQ